MRNWLPPLAIIGLTLMFLLLWESPPDAFRSQQPNDNQALVPNNILINNVNRRFNAEGRLVSMFTASETRYFQISRRGPTSSDYAELSKPELTLFGEDAPPWHIVAEEGKAEDQGDRILLWGKVRIWQTDQDKLSEFTTPFLIVEPERQYAETDKPVMITSAGSTTQAVGMKAYLKEDRIQLLSRVRGTHEPH